MSRSPKASPKNKSTTGAKRSAAKPNSSSKESRLAPAAESSGDAIAILQADHREVEQLFEQFEAANADSIKRDLAISICVALKVHARLEEELFYPAAYQALRDKSLIQEAQVEHASAKDLIAQIEAGAPGEAFYDARVNVLAEYIDHHVTEEEEEIFPQCRRSEMDLVALGAIMALRKQELLAGFLVSNPVLALS
jgi:hypothetical protein